VWTLKTVAHPSGEGNTVNTVVMFSDK